MFGIGVEIVILCPECHSEELLESYQSERYSNVIEYIKTYHMGDLQILWEAFKSQIVFSRKRWHCRDEINRAGTFFWTG